MPTRTQTIPGWHVQLPRVDSRVHGLRKKFTEQAILGLLINGLFLLLTAWLFICLAKPFLIAGAPVAMGPPGYSAGQSLDPGSPAPLSGARFGSPGPVTGGIGNGGW